MAIVRFRFFLPPPGADFSGGSWFTGFGDGTRETTGAGVADFRAVETTGTGSGGMLSALDASFTEANEAVECAAVACIAFIRREIFCCLLGTPEEAVVLDLADASGTPST